MMKRGIILTLLMTIAIPAWSADGFVIVTHRGVPTTSLSRDEWSAIFLKKTRTWSDGTPIVPLDREETSVVRISFTAELHRKRIAAVRTYWNQQIFAGREMPPIEKSSDAEVVAFVQATPGAVGYVSPNAPTHGVTRIELSNAGAKPSSPPASH